jgi:putative pyruvate formate lyase activating enzyme
MSRFDLVESGEFESRIKALYSLVSPCQLCPRRCGVDRTAGEVGHCGTAGAVVSAATAHFGEEPEITGARGSGTVFFAGCNLGCIYCQNHEISQGADIALAPSWEPEKIAGVMLDLQARRCSNINLVTPSHVVPWVVDALAIATRRGLVLPVVWNSSGYDSVEVLRLLDGIVDVYLPDLRYSDNEAGHECSSVPDYVERSHEAIIEMARQTGTTNVIGPDNVISRGMIIRLLVLPNDMSGVRESLDFIKETLGAGVRVALMSQYFPSHRAESNLLLSRPVRPTEYYRVVEYAEKLGFENALVQEMEASEFYRPDFRASDEPFVDARHFKAPADV